MDTVSVERNSISIVVYYFIQLIRYMFRSYDHLQVTGCKHPSLKVKLNEERVNG
jgi:hypothetical protein